MSTMWGYTIIDYEQGEIDRENGYPSEHSAAAAAQHYLDHEGNKDLWASVWQITYTQVVRPKRQ